MKEFELVKLLEAGLERGIQRDLINNIVSKHLAAAEKELRENLKPIVEQVTIGRIEQFKDMVNFSKDLKVELKWTNEEPPQ